MADISSEYIIFDAHESTENHCPICDGDTLEYLNYIVEDNLVHYPWTCGTCGAEGRDVSEMRFIGHDVHWDSLPEQVVLAYENGDVRQGSIAWTGGCIIAHGFPMPCRTNWVRNHGRNPRRKIMLNHVEYQ